ncbi:hypothetical protein FAES_1416 [Fibrella aestuarina BUZ 2]|uniref:Uncharacterized protein n=1 Tax=Fibrella aestuarina BUZ 2 TaxID=1166018 RepID=I0K5M3_9BACT|nr:hypothetical protein [Fibrella aestuarina]CCG99426.1 hypothetical protein FAES_1416 [Fibrella aestuarina BUZ 2]
MNLNEFTASLAQPTPPVGLNPILTALWHDANGDWEAAHEVAQSREGTPAYDRLHAYLHRKEGDAFNAGYWYRRARTSVYTGPLADEWRELVEANQD